MNAWGERARVNKNEPFGPVDGVRRPAQSSVQLPVERQDRNFGARLQRHGQFFCRDPRGTHQVVSHCVVFTSAVPQHGQVASKAGRRCTSNEQLFHQLALADQYVEHFVNVFHLLGVREQILYAH